MSKKYRTSNARWHDNATLHSSKSYMPRSTSMSHVLWCSSPSDPLVPLLLAIYSYGGRHIMLLFEGGRQQWTSHSMGLRCRAAIRPAFPSQVPQLLQAQLQIHNGTQSFSQTDCSHKAFFSSGHQHHAQQTFQEWTFGFSAHPFTRLLSAESQPSMIITPSFVLIALTFLSSTSPTFSHPSLNSCASLAPHLLVSLFLSRISVRSLRASASNFHRHSFVFLHHLHFSPSIYSTLKSWSLSCNSSASCTSEFSLYFLASWLPFH